MQRKERTPGRPYEQKRRKKQTSVRQTSRGTSSLKSSLKVDAHCQSHGLHILSKGMVSKQGN
jgi:hypothetical protein